MSVTIASIYPEAFFAVRELRAVGHEGEGGYRTTYNLAAAPRDGDPEILVVDDAYERVYISDNQYDDRFTKAEDIAKKLIRQWTGDMWQVGEGQAGIWICAGPLPTAEEKARHTAAQEQMFEGLAKHGEALFASHEPPPEICKKAVLWLDPNAAATHPWVKERKKQDLKKCPLCKKLVEQDAIFCEHCNQQIAALPAHLNFSNPATPAAPLPPPIKSPTVTGPTGVPMSVGQSKSTPVPLGA